MNAPVDDDAGWMAAAAALADKARGRSTPNPNVGCVIVRDGLVVGRGMTGNGGRPHAEAIALEQAGEAAGGATIFVTLEPCTHTSTRGPACAELIAAAGPARVVIALGDPDLRTDGAGISRLRDAGIEVATGVLADKARRAMAPWLTRYALGRPMVTLKLAMSLDGAVAMVSGESQWITGERARAHGHLERARHDAILVGRGTFDADDPCLDVRIAGLQERSPRRLVLTSGDGAEGWEAVRDPAAIANLDRVDSLLVEGGIETAAAFLRADLVDRLLLYRAPILVGGGRTLGDIGLARLADAHARWQLIDSRLLGDDRLDAYERVRSTQEA